MTGPTPNVAVGGVITTTTTNAVNAYLDDTGWIPVTTFALSWTASTAVFYRKKSGIVYLRGQLTGGTSGTAFTLPAGFLPAQAVMNWIVYSTGGATPTVTRVNINNLGAVNMFSATTPSLDPISYTADA